MWGIVVATEKETLGGLPPPEAGHIRIVFEDLDNSEWKPERDRIGNPKIDHASKDKEWRERAMEAWARTTHHTTHVVAAWAALRTAWAR